MFKLTTMSFRTLRRMYCYAVVIAVFTFPGWILVSWSINSQPIVLGNPILSDESLATYVERNNLCEKQKHWHLDPESQFTIKYIQTSPWTLQQHPAQSIQVLLDVCAQLMRLENEYFSRRSEKVSPFLYNVTTASRFEPCDDSTEVLFMVHSLHSHNELRRAIRDTWGGAIKNRTWADGRPMNVIAKLVFVFGLHKMSQMEEELDFESQLNGDVVRGNFIEDYHNLTLKSLLALKWAITYCPRIKYLVKSDDDMVINIPHLYNLLRDVNHERFIMGPYNGRSKVDRLFKWSISVSEYPFYYYPPYEAGSAYVISGSLLSTLFNTSEYVPHIYIDDVYITGILGKIVGVTHVVKPGFAYAGSPKNTHCDLIYNRIVTGTKMRAIDLLEIWHNIRNNVRCK